MGNVRKKRGQLWSLCSCKWRELTKHEAKPRQQTWRKPSWTNRKRFVRIHACVGMYECLFHKNMRSSELFRSLILFGFGWKICTCTCACVNFFRLAVCLPIMKSTHLRGLRNTRASETATAGSAICKLRNWFGKRNVSSSSCCRLPLFVLFSFKLLLFT